MRFLRRGGGAEPQPIEQRLATFWAWWAGAREGVARDIATGTIANRAGELSAAVKAVDERLAWELGKGTAGAQHALVVSCEGNAELRPIALQWVAAAPPADETWEYHPSRQSGPPHVLEIRGVRVSLGEMRALANWDNSHETLDVRLWHPAFDGLPTQVKGQICFLFLDNLVGEDDVERWIGAIDADPLAADGMTVDQLREEIRQRATTATGDQWSLIEATDVGDDPVLVRLNSSLKRIDHPSASGHLAVAIDLGFDQLDQDVLPTVTEAEDALVASLDGIAAEAARVTNRRSRVSHFVTADGDRALALARAWAEAHADWGAKATLESDPNWTFRRAYGG